jgi:aspartate/methionine/tyrosine aminotransferase
MKKKLNFSEYDSVKKIYNSDSIFLAGGVPNVNPGNNIFQDISITEVTSYEDTYGSSELILTYLERELESPYLSEVNILPTSGATSALYIALTTICRSQDEVLILSPCWSIYKKACEGLDVRYSEIYPVDLDSLSYSLEHIRAKVTNKTKAILFASPSNPTGKHLDDSIKQSLIQLAIENNITLLVDETYVGLEYKSKASLLDLMDSKDLDNVIVIRSLSKFYCSPGLRVGFIISSERLIPHFHFVSRNMYLSVSTITQKIALKVIQYVSGSNWHKDACLNNLLKFLSLSETYKPLKVLVPECAFFVTFSIAYHNEEPITTEELFNETNLVLRDCSDFGLNGYCRMNLSVKPEVFNIVLNRLSNFIEKRAKTLACI